MNEKKENFLFSLFHLVCSFVRVHRTWPKKNPNNALLCSFRSYIGCPLPVNIISFFHFVCVFFLFLFFIFSLCAPIQCKWDEVIDRGKRSEMKEMSAHTHSSILFECFLQFFFSRCIGVTLATASVAVRPEKKDIFFKATTTHI